MAFNFFRWLAGIGGTAVKTEVTAEDFFNLYSDTYFRELALQSCINLSARALSKCEFRTFARDKPIKGHEYYRWNIEPNQNQNSSVFLNKLINKLFRENKVLVVESGGKLYVADSYTEEEYALKDNIFSSVTVDNFTFKRTFTMSEVIFFRLAGENAKTVIDGLYSSYRELIRFGMKGYQKSRGEKGTLEIDAMSAGDKQAMETYEELRNKGFKKFAEAENAMMPLYKGMKYTSLANKTYSADSTRDIRAMIDDVTDFTARGYGIPPQLVNGSVQDVGSAMEQFLTFHIDPLVDMLQEEINRKIYGFYGFANGDYLQIDTGSIKHIDILSSATNIDKLVSSGVVCINDIRVLLGEPIIPEPWAYQHFMTKNYSTVADVLAAMEKGGKTE